MPRRLLLALLTTLSATALPAAAHADAGVLVHQDQVLGLRDTAGDVDGILEAGDTVEVVQRFLNPSAAEVQAITGTLELTASQDVSVLEGGRTTFPDAPAGRRTANTSTPFKLKLGPTVRCGTTIKLATTLRDDSDEPGVVGFGIRTGTPAIPVVKDAPALDVEIPSNGRVVETAFTVSGFAEGDTAADVALRLLKIDHPNAAELAFELVPPGATRGIPVIEGTPDGEAGTGFTGTVLRAQGTTTLGIGGTYGAGPFRAEALDLLNGSALNGTWKLRVADVVGNDGAAPGRIKGWGLELAPAVCDPVVRARITGVEGGEPVRAGTPGVALSLSALESVLPTGRQLDKVEWDSDGDGDWDVTTPRPDAPTGDWTLLPFTQPAAGLHPVRLRVTDDAGATAEEDVLFPFSNKPAVSSLVVDPGGPQPTFEDLLFKATASDPDGDAIADFLWDLNGDLHFEEATGADPTFFTRFQTPGDKKVRVRAVDGYGVRSDPVLLVVTSVNQAPTASLTISDWVVRGEPAVLSAETSSDRDGTIVGTAFDLDGSGTCETAYGTARTAPVTLTSARTLGICVKDDKGLTDYESKLVHVHDRPVARLVSPTPTPRPKAVTTLSAETSSDDDGPLERFEWDLDGDGAFELDTETVPTTTVSWPTEGPRTVRVRVTDAREVTAVASVVLTVTNQRPVAVIAVTPATPVAGSAVTFDASGSSDAEDGGIAQFDWDLDGNGTYEKLDAGPEVRRTYPSAMTAKVGVRVKDSDGGPGTATRTLSIAAAPVPDVPLPPPPGGTITVVDPGGSTGGGGDAGSGGTSVPVPAVPAAPVVPVPTTPAPVPAAAPKPTVALVVAPRQKLADLLKGGLRTTCAVTGATVCTVRVTVDAAQARRLRLVRRPRAPITVASRSGAPGTARLKAKKELLAGLRRASRLKVVVSATVVDAGGRATVTRTLTLKR